MVSEEFDPKILELEKTESTNKKKRKKASSNQTKVLYARTLDGGYVK
jgi:hypothetical protein